VTARKISPQVTSDRITLTNRIILNPDFGGLRLGLLDLFKRPKVTVRVADDVLVVTMPGTAFSITYAKTNKDQLVVRSFRKGLDAPHKVSFPKFLSLAWTAANARAREVGLIEKTDTS
jgi:hypothetical protein